MWRVRPAGLVIVVVAAVLAGITLFAVVNQGRGSDDVASDRPGPSAGADSRAPEASGAGQAADRGGLSASGSGLGAGGLPVEASPEESRWVEATLAGLSLEQRVGQMIMGYVFGTSGSDRDPTAMAGNRRTSGVATAAEAVAAHSLGGVIYFDAGGTGPGALPDNIVDPAQVTGLSADLRAAAAVPLLIATDQEQGPVLRVRDGVTLLPSQMAQGATGRPDDAREAARITGTDLRALGINVNFAPDADVNSDPANPVIGERSFGDDPGAVGRFTAAAINGYRQAGVAAAAKHFPGHGATSVDSHVALPTITRDRAALDAVDLPPFRAAIAADTPMVMVGHLNVPALDRDAPAPLSRAVVDGLLRRELGYDGIIVTDALNMAAITDHNSPARAAVRAVQAGVDMLLMPPDVVQARDAVVSAVRSGMVTPDRVDASVRRLLRLKWRLAHSTPTAPGTPQTRTAAAEAIAARAITLLDQPACDLLPLRRNPLPATPVEVSGPATAARLLVAALGERGTPATQVPSGAVATTPRAPTAPGSTATPVRVVLAGNSPPPTTDRRTVVVSTGTPYRPPPGAGAWLATYSRDPASMKALAAVLTGATTPTGRLPVTTRTATGTLLPRGATLPAPRTC
ncbi:glycoside hydrolase family 3 protein [Parafrankia elaeagni]|uniref:glycoside hydrolase family 3 protein n=1 Tax=Parafrankia elaeagni TaxID=222534 RepID=UPI000375CCC2|nr:glycoside hydrolase family 3 N-terminal domain-containing protein [Parafrankia elaeagni]